MSPRPTKVKTVVWTPMCEACAIGHALLLLGPNDHPCKGCGEPVYTAVREERAE